MNPAPAIAVIGLGYVGLPLAVALARHFPVVGLDKDPGRVAEIKRGHDRTGEVEDSVLSGSSLVVSDDPDAGRGANIFIVTVPTPVDAGNKPDFSAIDDATRQIAGLVDPARCPTIVYESTVYPGVTEGRCGAMLAEAGLVRGRDFRLGYSPERINPGDKVHTVDRIVKVIAGEDADVLDQLDRVYGAVTSAGTFRAASIKAAEAAKVIENAQRDINVAFMNEVAKIVADVGVSAWDVIEAAKTKWNFMAFEPGLVGGHCIGVDPYYLADLAQQLGHDPRVILSGRGTNDGMSGWIAEQLHQRRGKRAGRVLLLGLTFKENVPDLRNSRSLDLVRSLEALGHEVSLVDPVADPTEIEALYGRPPVELGDERYDLVIGAVRHETFAAMGADAIRSLLTPEGTLADIKGMWRRHGLEKTLDYWTL